MKGFIGTDPYREHKAKRFRGGDERDIMKNQAFILSDPKVRAKYERAYDKTSALYYRGKPSFAEILARIASYANRL